MKFFHPLIFSLTLFFCVAYVVNCSEFSNNLESGTSSTIPSDSQNNLPVNYEFQDPSIFFIPRDKVLAGGRFCFFSTFFIFYSRWNFPMQYVLNMAVVFLALSSLKKFIGYSINLYPFSLRRIRYNRSSGFTSCWHLYSVYLALFMEVIVISKKNIIAESALQPSIWIIGLLLLFAFEVIPYSNFCLNHL